MSKPIIQSNSNVCIFILHYDGSLLQKHKDKNAKCSYMFCIDDQIVFTFHSIFILIK